jgi:hypothetical protein
MGVVADDTSIDVGQKSMVLLTVSMSHPGSTVREPKMTVLNVEVPNAQDKADRQNFITDDEGTVDDNGRTTYELRLSIAPGKYVIMAGTGFIRVFPITALFQAPFLLDMDVPKNSVIYVGHIEATMRPMGDHDFRAGPLLPVFDQAAMGVSTSTFDVFVRDDSTTDIPLFRANFPALKDTSIKVQILPPFDRAKAYAWWLAEP